jgi:serine/threonine protein kinase
MKAQDKIRSYVDEIFPPEDITGYQVKKIIGKGSYGHVAKAVRKNLNELVAIKKISGLSNSLP